MKPENLMLDARQSTVKICDFGTAQVFTDQSSTTQDTFKGSPAFYAPEACDANVEQPEILPLDLWALGVTVYLLSYGKLPYAGATFVLLDKIKDDPVPFPARDKDSINAEVREFLQWLLDKDATTRPDIAQVKLHPWMQTGRPMPTLTSLQCAPLVPTEEQKLAAISPLMTFGRAVTMKLLGSKVARRARRNSAQRIDLLGKAADPELQALITECSAEEMRTIRSEMAIEQENDRNLFSTGAIAQARVLASAKVRRKQLPSITSPKPRAEVIDFSSEKIDVAALLDSSDSDEEISMFSPRFATIMRSTVVCFVANCSVAALATGRSLLWRMDN